MKLRAFTMAEMLVAMAIIGIVSALTIPTLKQDYQKKMYVAKLQKATHVLENSIKIMLVEEGARNLRRTELFDCADDIFDYPNSHTDDVRTCINNHLSKYFKIVRYGKVGANDYNYLEATNLAGGEISPDTIHGPIYGAEALRKAYYFYAGDNILYVPFVINRDIYVDVNGTKAPNRVGRDIFVLGWNDQLNGITYPCSNGEWKEEGPCLCDDELTGAGRGCAARIKEEGWKMNY